VVSSDRGHCAKPEWVWLGLMGWVAVLVESVKKSFLGENAPIDTAAPFCTRFNILHSLL